MKDEARIVLRIVLMTLAVAGIIVVYHWAAEKFRAPPIVTTTQHAAATAVGVQAAAVMAKAPLQGQLHAEDIARAVLAASKRNPDSRIQTNGAEWEKAAEGKRIETKSDFVMITDPKRPADRPIVKASDQVTLNAYYIKAYPNNFQQIGYAPPATVMASASWKIGKSKTKEWYVGVWGSVDFKHPEQGKIGVVFTRM